VTFTAMQWKICGSKRFDTASHQSFPFVELKITSESAWICHHQCMRWPVATATSTTFPQNQDRQRKQQGCLGEGSWYSFANSCPRRKGLQSVKKAFL